MEESYTTAVKDMWEGKDDVKRGHGQKSGGVGDIKRGDGRDVRGVI